MTKVEEGALPKAPEKHQDRAWQKRIETAKEARSQGKQARQGKAAIFPTRRLTPNP